MTAEMGVVSDRSATEPNNDDPRISEDSRLPIGAEQGLSKEMKSDWYDTAYETTAEYHKHYTASIYFPLWTVVLYCIGSIAPKSVLEIGCGPGQLAQAIHEHYPAISYSGFDFSDTAIGMARTNVPSYRFEVADALSTDLYTECQAELAVCIEVLEHIQEDLVVIERVPSGTEFVGSVPNFDSTSHVRYFADPQQVAERYGRYFDKFAVHPIRFNDIGGEFFLFRGEKR